MNWIQNIVADVQKSEPFWGMIVRPLNGCDLPKQFMERDHITLQLGYALERPPELAIKDGCVEIVASFGMTNYVCNIPWRAVDALITPDTMIIFRPGPQLSERMAASTEPPPKPSHLKIVK